MVRSVEKVVPVVLLTLLVANFLVGLEARDMSSKPKASYQPQNLPGTGSFSGIGGFRFRLPPSFGSIPKFRIPNIPSGRLHTGVLPGGMHGGGFPTGGLGGGRKPGHQ